MDDRPWTMDKGLKKLKIKIKESRERGEMGTLNVKRERVFFSFDISISHFKNFSYPIQNPLRWDTPSTLWHFGQK